MGAWGTQPFENDSAADFVGDLKRVPKRRRLVHVRAAFESYLGFDADPNKFAARAIDLGNVTKALKATVRHSIAIAKRNGHPVPAQMAKFVGKSDEELLALLPAIPAYDGGHEALTAIAAAELLLARLRNDRVGTGQILATASPASVRHLLPLARRALDAILRNDKLRDSWNEGPRGPWRRKVQKMTASLKAAMTANGALQRTRSKRRAVERGR